MCISAGIICKFLRISVRFICKSLFISVRFVSFFYSKAPTPQGSFYLFTFLPFYLSMSLPEKQKLVSLHYEITRKRTLGNRKKTIGKSYENDWKMIGKSLEDYWRIIGGLLEDYWRTWKGIQTLPPVPVHCDSVAGQPPTPSLPSTPTPESSLQVLTPPQGAYCRTIKM